MQLGTVRSAQLRLWWWWDCVAIATAACTRWACCSIVHTMRLTYAVHTVQCIQYSAYFPVHTQCIHSAHSARSAHTVHTVHTVHTQCTHGALHSVCAHGARYTVVLCAWWHGGMVAWWYSAVHSVQCMLPSAHTVHTQCTAQGVCAWCTLYIGAVRMVLWHGALSAVLWLGAVRCGVVQDNSWSAV